MLWTTVSTCIIQSFYKVPYSNLDSRHSLTVVQLDWVLLGCMGYPLLPILRHGPSAFLAPLSASSSCLVLGRRRPRRVCFQCGTSGRAKRTQKGSQEARYCPREICGPEHDGSLDCLWCDIGYCPCRLVVLPPTDIWLSRFVCRTSCSKKVARLRFALCQISVGTRHCKSPCWFGWKCVANTDLQTKMEAYSQAVCF